MLDIEQLSTKIISGRRSRSAIILTVAFAAISFCLFNEPSSYNNNNNPQIGGDGRRYLLNKHNKKDKASRYLFSADTSDSKEMYWNGQRDEKERIKRELQMKKKLLRQTRKDRKLVEEADEEVLPASMAQAIQHHYERRMDVLGLYANEPQFEDCVGKTVTECQLIIDTFVQANPETFNNQTSLFLDIRKIREVTDIGYYKAVLRTDMTGQKVVGIFDDGVVFYPWSWMVSGQPTTIGPWDCDEMTPEECCTMIQEDTPLPDDSGNFLACFVEEPVGGPNNPKREDRAIVVTDRNLNVVRAPIAH